MSHPEFAKELPRFVAFVRGLFTPQELRAHLAQIEREPAEYAAENDDEDDKEFDNHAELISETPSGAAGRARRFALASVQFPSYSWLRTFVAGPPDERTAGRAPAGSDPRCRCCRLFAAMGEDEEGTLAALRAVCRSQNHRASPSHRQDDRRRPSRGIRQPG
jgi:hypothetical protein